MITNGALLELIHAQEAADLLTKVATGELVVAVLELTAYIVLAIMYIKTRLSD